MEAKSPIVVMLLLRSPEWTNYGVVIRLGLSFMAAGASVTLFVMDDAVLGLVPILGRGPESYPLFPLVQGGAKVLACQSTAEVRGVLRESLPPGVCFETQVQLGHLAGSADLFLPFSG